MPDADPRQGVAPSSSERALAAERERYRDLFEGASLALLVTDERGIVREANRATAELLRCPSLELLGQPLVELVAPHDRRELGPRLSEPSREEVVAFATLRVRKQDVPVRLHGRAERAPSHEGWRRWTVERVAAIEPGTAAPDLSMLGHELRNPLAAIRGAVELWRRHGAQLSEEQRSWTVDVVSRQTDRLAHVIDELMDVARLAEGRIRLRRAVIDVRESIAEADDVLRGQTQLHDVVLELPDTPLLVDADPLRLRQIVVHLLENALAFTPRGGRIVVSAREDHGAARIAIKDGGTGLAPDRLDELLGRVAPSAGGPASDDATGIGLAVVRRLVELHGGTVGAWSDAARGGTEVTVTLPLAEATDARDGDPQLRAPLRLLVVDDNVDAAETLGILLEAQGHMVTLAFDGASAIELVGRAKPDAVLLDLGLPDLDGLEIARHVKATAPAVHLIAVTGYGGEQTRARAREAGFSAHLVKPVANDALRRALMAVRPRVDATPPRDA